MVAGGVGLAPFATLAEALAARGTPTHAVLRRAHRRRICYREEFFEALGARLSSRPKTAAAASAAA